MKKTPVPSIKSKAKPVSPGEEKKGDAKVESQAHPSGVRETVESVVIAFVLAFLFRTFEAEAFVIPTGSMAPTLMGRHKDIAACPKCGAQYSAGASNEVSNDPNAPPPNPDLVEIVSVTCPMCRFPLDVNPQTDGGKEYYSYQGDRILVGKFPYEFAEPQRWDVIVFKYPVGANTNYIKRLVGLPGEKLQLKYGDVYTSTEGKPFEIARKPPDKLLAMLQPVYDTKFVSDELVQSGWPTRWQPADGSNWKILEGGRSFEIDGSSADLQWVRYLHTYPINQDWQAVAQKGPPDPLDMRPKLITDFYAYNSGMARGRGNDFKRDALGMHWVGDLAIEATLEVKSPQGQLLFDLVEGGVHFRATIDVATGEARLTIEGRNDFQAVAKTSLVGAGSYDVRFANIDDELRLWINNSLVTFDTPTTYPPLGNNSPASTAGDPGDLAPVGIGSAGAAVRVSRARVLRDIYYIADRSGRRGGYDSLITEYDYDSPLMRLFSAESAANFFASPSLWTYRGRSVFDDRAIEEFDLLKDPQREERDEFFALGDNSPASADSRLWHGHNFVERELLIGKALYIYWPHAWPTKYNVKIPGFDVRVPFIPNFKRMRFIR